LGEGIIMNKDERIGESIWNTYKMMGDVLAEGLQDQGCES